jgi:hypothetical protein
MKYNQWQIRWNICIEDIRLIVELFWYSLINGSKPTVFNSNQEIIIIIIKPYECEEFIIIAFLIPSILFDFFPYICK